MVLEEAKPHLFTLSEQYFLQKKHIMLGTSCIIMLEREHDWFGSFCGWIWKHYYNTETGRNSLNETE